MKKIYLLLPIFLFSLVGRATNYYVDIVNGNNANTGLSATDAFKTIPTAAVLTYGGDTVFIMQGNYPAFSISRPGDATAQVVYTNYPGSTPQIVATDNTYNLITINAGANYVTVNGLELVGWGVNLSLAADTIPAQAAIVCPPGATSTTNVTFIPKYNGNGINVGNSSSIVTHHVTLSNNKIHDCCAVGIGVGYSDYITLEGNTVYNNSWYTPYGTSGISFGNSANYDNNTTSYRNIVRNNVCYGNRLYVLWRGSCTISDGNGIILDIPRPDYNGKTLVANNLCYNNGGSGIHTLEMDHVDFLNNTVYLNAASPTNNGSELYAYNADDVKFYNNIIYARPGKTVNRSPNATNIIYDYNVYYGGGSLDFVGANSLIQDPKFVNAATNPAVADFHLQQNSFAVNNGSNSNTILLDKDGVTRPVAGRVDMGIYESPYAGNLNVCSGALQNKVLGSGAGTGETGAIFFGPYDSKPGTNNQKSRRAIIYPQSLIAANGVPSISTLNSLQFRRALQAGSTQVTTNNSIIKIYLRNEATDNFGNTAFDWNTILPTALNPAVLVYAGEAAPLMGNSGGWKEVNFQVPFSYTGANLGIYIEYLQKGFIASAPDINWIYDNGGSQPLYNTATNANQLYATKATAASSNTAIADILSTNSERRPVLTLTYCSTAVVPVKLLQFYAVKQNAAVTLNWLVTNELNNAGFEVQRSDDGLHFLPEGWVNSKALNGVSALANSYSFIDNKPVRGIAYYRLLQRDIDGRITYSFVITIKEPSKELSLVSIYPNPADNKLFLLVRNEKAKSSANISLQDLSGRVLKKIIKEIAVGYTYIELNVADLAAATYLLVVETEGNKLINKMIKK